MASERLSEWHEERRSARSAPVAAGTLACPDCDAPVALGSWRAAPTDELGCPFCLRTGALREFLSLADPARPARVVVRVR